jgi:hypothetical protein
MVIGESSDEHYYGGALRPSDELELQMSIGRNDRL